MKAKEWAIDPKTQQVVEWHQTRLFSGVHVIEAAPVLAEIAQLRKENAALKADLQAIYKAMNGG